MRPWWPLNSILTPICNVASSKSTPSLRRQSASHAAEAGPTAGALGEGEGTAKDGDGPAKPSSSDPPATAATPSGGADGGGAATPMRPSRSSAADEGGAGGGGAAPKSRAPKRSLAPATEAAAGVATLSAECGNSSPMPSRSADGCALGGGGVCAGKGTWSAAATAAVGFAIASLREEESLPCALSSCFCTTDSRSVKCGIISSTVFLIPANGGADSEIYSLARCCTSWSSAVECVAINSAT
mmetsp:Transcript_38688/g.90446  ORF Transcript_38688/g.90446 Transcript_38688/m.90446 type:complete len:242 (+) Transcript_38688:1377-2102(+)